MLSSISTVCFLCGKNNFILKYRLKEKEIFCCKNDGLFISKEAKIIKINYDRNYYNQSPYPLNSKFNDNYFQTKLNKIISLTGELKPNVLDIGCGWGNFLEVLKKNNISYLGVDSSKEAIKICTKKGLNCQIASISHLIENGQKYSAITCFQVLEHLKNPLDFLTSIKNLLKTNGVLILTTPNNDSPLRKILKQKWPVYNTDSHFVFYNKNTLKKIMFKTGFKKIKVRLDSPRFMSLTYIISRTFLREFKFLNNIPIPTDPFGDLEIIVRK